MSQHRVLLTLPPSERRPVRKPSCFASRTSQRAGHWRQSFLLAWCCSRCLCCGVRRPQLHRLRRQRLPYLRRLSRPVLLPARLRGRDSSGRGAWPRLSHHAQCQATAVAVRQTTPPAPPARHLDGVIRIAASGGARCPASDGLAAPAGCPPPSLHAPQLVVFTAARRAGATLTVRPTRRMTSW